MKKIFLLATIFMSLTVYGQNDTAYVEQYCNVVATPRLLSNKVTIDIDFGEERSIWKDNRMRTEEGKLKKFNTVIDALNYMGKSGWKLVNAYPVAANNGPLVYHYIFKKEFPKSEAQE